MKLVGVKGKRGLVKDLESNAVININNSEIEKAKVRKQKTLEEKQKVENQKERIDSLVNEVSEIKTILNQLLEKL